ncbi:hypothetical protein EUGRSUZ_E04164 [Eucalyptus grandis]|uniref:Uncharacterized protein n=2 Tax=Eucalyptus grandis TaxID=71139 RepID=A0ACC3L280_EUCGR|nr:hypothetical protein EUGRSUZ_E04164 [Eucalyptus grandis]
MINRQATTLYLHIFSRWDFFGSIHQKEKPRLSHVRPKTPKRTLDPLQLTCNNPHHQCRLTIPKKPAPTRHARASHPIRCIRQWRHRRTAELLALNLDIGW